jgi:hypothetical protein
LDRYAGVKQSVQSANRVFASWLRLSHTVQRGRSADAEPGARRETEGVIGAQSPLDRLEARLERLTARVDELTRLVELGNGAQSAPDPPRPVTHVLTRRNRRRHVGHASRF